MISLDVNTKEISWYTNKLEKMHQSAFPNAVRGTLTGLAIDVKKVTMPKTSNEFTNRNKTFFSANSKYMPARGFDVNTMESVVGMFPNANVKNDKAVKELEQQEHGGIIKDRDFIPLSRARISNKLERKVSTKNTLGKLPELTAPNIFNVAKNKAKTKKQKFIRTIIEAKKSSYSTVYILGNKHDGGKQTLSRIDFFGSNLKSRKLVIKRTPLYKYEKGKTVRVKATNFMKRASYESGLKANALYIKEAQRQYERYYNS